MEESSEADFVTEFDLPVTRFNRVQLVADDTAF
jgi:hypothetical protein